MGESQTWFTAGIIFATSRIRLVFKMLKFDRPYRQVRRHGATRVHWGSGGDSPIARAFPVLTSFSMACHVSGYRLERS